MQNDYCKMEVNYLGKNNYCIYSRHCSISPLLLIQCEGGTANNDNFEGM